MASTVPSAVPSPGASAFDRFRLVWPPTMPAHHDPTPLRTAARNLGFHRLGVAAARRSPHADRFLAWLSKGHHGTMGYLAEQVERRIDPRETVPGAQSVIVVSLPYADDVDLPAPDETSRGKISRYARGRDYHRVMQGKLRRLAETMRDGDRYRTWYTVDAGPLLERDWAEAAGIGWIGKNALVIDPEIGSWFFLGAIVTDRPYQPDAPRTRPVRALHTLPRRLSHGRPRHRAHRRRPRLHLLPHHRAPRPGPDRVRSRVARLDPRL